MGNEIEKTVGEHLSDLKSYLLVNIVSIIVLLGFYFSYSKRILNLLLRYYGISGYVFSPFESLQIQLNFSLFMAIITVIPIAVMSLYFYCREFVRIEAVLLWAMNSFVLGLIGAFVGATYVSKYVLDNLVSLSFAGSMWGINNIFNVVISISFTLALILQLVLIIPFLTKIGLISGNFYRKKRVYILFIFFIIICFITPDPTLLTSLLLFIPLTIVIEFGFFISKFVGGKNDRDN